MQDNVIIETINLHKEHKRDEFKIVALQNANLIIHKGEFVALMGPSGSGKSTLLYLIAAIDRPTEGRVRVLGQDLQELNDKGIAHWRNEHIGFVFQTFNLIPVLTARENVELPLLLTHLSKKERIEHAETALKLVGLEDRMSHYPRQLSGGQEQRVAIARAIVKEPAIILADEPTGNLDTRTGDQVLELLASRCRQFGTALMMATHSPLTCRFTDRMLRMVDGIVVEETFSGEKQS